MGARAEFRRDLVVAAEAGSSRCRSRVSGFGCARVAVETRKVLVNAVSQSVGPHRDGFAVRIHQPRAGPMARNTVICSLEGYTG